MLRKPEADGEVADGVFEDQVPADDPGDEFSHRGVGVGVRAARNRNHGGELGVAHRGESAGDGDQDKGESNGRPRAGASKGSGMVNQVFQERGVENRRGLKLLTGNGRADDSKYAGADDRADAERSESQPSKRLF